MSFSTENSNNDSNSPQFPPVQEEEQGQKLLQFLQRRLNLPQNMLHRWLRSGQVRVNGKRCKPFQRLAAGDLVRIPPFAQALPPVSPEKISCPQQSETATSNTDTDLAIIASYGDILAINKPAGLPVQPGSGHTDCVVSRLAQLYGNEIFRPVPCHRLDRDTTGILLVAKTFSALRQTQSWLLFGQIRKEYLAWVHGQCAFQEPKLLRHYLRKQKIAGKTAVHASLTPLPWAKEAVCLVKTLKTAAQKSLLQIRLLTGRTHQIRAQLAQIGHPVLGDGKYGPEHGQLMLHAMRVILPDGNEFSCLPQWQRQYMPDRLPEPLPDNI